MLITKYQMHLLDLWHSGNDNVFYLVVQYNPLQVGMHDRFLAISHLIYKNHCKLYTNFGFSI